MPELPEVETVRRGLAGHVAGRTVVDVDFRHGRTLRRQPGGVSEAAHRLIGATLGTPGRRGKFLWFPLGGTYALVAHLGMSGQFRVGGSCLHDPHARAVMGFADGGPQLVFVDQRTFGWLAAEEIAPDVHGERVPLSVAGIALDVLDHRFDDEAWQRALRARRTTVKRALLDQSLQSGIGNIYADEALWRARLHPERATSRLRRRDALVLIGEVRAVMLAALESGGTSFDSLYVDVNGSSGYFDRSLAVYGRAGRPCPRCATEVVRQPFANRSSHFCPRCQTVPR